MGRKRKGGGNEERRIRLDDAELARLFADGETIAELAKRYGCSTHPIKQALGRLGLHRPAKPRPGVSAGPKNPQWRGGRRTRSDGYIEVWIPGGEVLEHRQVAEQHLGRALMPGEIVHHRDGNRANNSAENLEVTTQAEHVHHHIADMHAARYGR